MDVVNKVLEFRSFEVLQLFCLEVFWLRKDLSVDGMHCRSCGLLIAQDVSKVAGVSSVEADFKSGRVSVDFDGSSETLGKVVSAIKKLGYKVR